MKYEKYQEQEHPPAKSQTVVHPSLHLSAIVSFSYKCLCDAMTSGHGLCTCSENTLCDTQTLGILCDKIIFNVPESYYTYKA